MNIIPFREPRKQDHQDEKPVRYAINAAAYWADQLAKLALVPEYREQMANSLDLNTVSAAATQMQLVGSLIEVRMIANEEIDDAV